MLLEGLSYTTWVQAGQRYRRTIVLRAPAKKTCLLTYLPTDLLAYSDLLIHLQRGPSY